MNNTENKKTYIIKIGGELQDKLEKETSKNYYSYTTIFKLALIDWLEKNNKK